MKYHIANVELSYASDFSNLHSFEVASQPRAYSVTWDDTANPCSTINQLLAENKNNILLIDEKVLALYGESIEHDVTRILAVPATENFKTLDGAVQVFDFLYQNNFTKSDRLIVVGGGIIQDVAAFVGATYKRGISWVYLPSTLLSMSDSCIGGKAGMNYKEAKNQLALFSSPHAVIINPAFLKTLAKRDLQSGLGEILKLFLTAGEPMMVRYTQCIHHGEMRSWNDAKTLIFGALCIKKAVIEKDEFENNIRKALNYGHTLGHALESMSQYQIPHGIAVVLGMLLVNELSFQQGFLTLHDHQKVSQLCLDLLDETLLALIKTLDMRDVIRYLKQDKKVTGTDITFVMLRALGHLDFVRLKMDDVLVLQITQAFDDLFVSCCEQLQ